MLKYIDGTLDESHTRGIQTVQRERVSAAVLFLPPNPVPGHNGPSTVTEVSPYPKENN